MYEATRYVDSAREAEACWQATHDPLLTYLAAQARASAGYRAHAVVWYRRYLALIPGDAPQRGGAEGRLAAVMAGMVAVMVEAAPGQIAFLREGQTDELVLDWEGGEGVVHLEPGQWRGRTEGGAVPEQMFQVLQAAPENRVVLLPPVVAPVSRPAPVPVEVHVTPAWALRPGARLVLISSQDPAKVVALTRTTTQVSVTPGTWRATLRLPGREVLERELLVRGPVRLSFAPGLDRTSKARVGLGVGLGTASLGLFTWGAAWMASGRRTAAGVKSSADALHSYALRVDGAAVFAAGAGALGVAVTDAFGLRKGVLGIETGIGAGLMVAGTAWLVGEKYRMAGSTVSDSEGMTPQELLAGQRPRETAAAVMLGLGAGTAVAGMVSLITAAAVKRESGRVRRLEPLVGPWSLGMRGRF